MPAVITLASDHSPAHLKKRAVGFIYCAIPLGALLLAAGVGAFATCGQAAIFALAPLCYGPEVRTTGVGATVSAGRFGTIAGPLMAGSLLGSGRSAAEVLIVLIPITLVSGLFVVGVARILGRPGIRAAS